MSLITFRPEFQPPWTGYAHVTTLTMSRLGRRQGADLVARVSGDKPLPPEIVEQIVARTDGVPLFVEELTKTVLESGLLADAGDHYELTGPLPPLAIPTTLHDSLMARLDRLGPVKEVAQIGAVIGREFSYELLAAVAPMSANRLNDALEQLVNSELVFGRGTPPDAIYTFKHALVQDAAYQSLLKSKRQQLHARIVQVLEQRFPDVMDTKPELLAHHCVEGRLIEKAVAYWYRAGQQAIARSTLAEAAAHLAKGLEMLRVLPGGSERDRQELDLQIALGVALIPLKGQASPATGQVYARAYELCRRIGETKQLFPVLYGQWVTHHTRAELAAARLVAEELLQLGQRQANAGVQVIAHRALGTGAMFMGEFGSAAAQLERTIAIYDPATHGNLAFPVHPGSGAYGASLPGLCTWSSSGMRIKRARGIGEVLARGPEPGPSQYPGAGPAHLLLSPAPAPRRTGCCRVSRRADPAVGRAGFSDTGWVWPRSLRAGR